MFLRPPFRAERLRLRSDGRVVLELKTASHDGTRELVFEPLEFLGRLRWVQKSRFIATACHDAGVRTDSTS